MKLSDLSGKMYYDMTTGKGCRWVKRVLPKEEVEVLVTDGERMLQLFDEPHIREIGHLFIALDPQGVVVEINGGSFRNLNDLMELDSGGKPIQAS